MASIIADATRCVGPGSGRSLLVLGIAGTAYGAEAGEQIIGALVAIIGVVQIIFGGMQRKTEDVAPSATEPTPHTP